MFVQVTKGGGWGKWCHILRICSLGAFTSPLGETWAWALTRSTCRPPLPSYCTAWCWAATNKTKCDVRVPINNIARIPSASHSNFFPYVIRSLSVHHRVLSARWKPFPPLSVSFEERSRGEPPQHTLQRSPKSTPPDPFLLPSAY